MPAINNEGTYEVTIKDLRFEQTSEIPPQIAIKIDGVTDEGDYATGSLFLSAKIIQGGKYKGKKLWETTLDTLKKLGMKSDNPKDAKELIGSRCKFVMQYNEYNGKTYLQVAFINPVTGKVVEGSDLDSILNDIMGQPQKTVKKPVKEVNKESEHVTTNIEISKEVEDSAVFDVEDEDIPF